MAYNILVVDDSKTVRSMISRTLELSGIPLGEFHQAADGNEALRILKDHWIDLMFTDINMPGMGGVELVRRMESEGLLSLVPVVVVSTEGSRTRIRELEEKGIRRYIRKPFTPEQLKEVVEDVLGAIEGDS